MRRLIASTFGLRRAQDTKTAFAAHEKLGHQFAHCSTTSLGYGRQLPFKALLVHLFPKPVPKFTIDFIDCTANGVAFFWIYQLSVHAKNYSKRSCGIVSLVSKISCSLRSRRFRVPRRRFSCRGHLTRTEGRDDASPPREGRSDRKGKEQSEECERDLKASEATRRLKRRSRASDVPRFVVARSECRGNGQRGTGNGEREMGNGERIRPLRVGATHREMCLRRRRQVGRDRRSSREADARAHANTPSEASAEGTNLVGSPSIEPLARIAVYH